MVESFNAALKRTALVRGGRQLRTTALGGFGILPGFHGTLVRDDYAGYVQYDRQLTAVQLCCAHLLRSLRGSASWTPIRTASSGPWPTPPHYGAVTTRPWPGAS